MASEVVLGSERKPEINEAMRNNSNWKMLRGALKGASGSKKAEDELEQLVNVGLALFAPMGDLNNDCEGDALNWTGYSQIPSANFWGDMKDQCMEFAFRLRGAIKSMQVRLKHFEGERFSTDGCVILVHGKNKDQIKSSNELKKWSKILQDEYLRRTDEAASKIQDLVHMCQESKGLPWGFESKKDALAMLTFISEMMGVELCVNKEGVIIPCHLYVMARDNKTRYRCVDSRTNEFVTGGVEFPDLIAMQKAVFFDPDGRPDKKRERGSDASKNANE